jgi:hypothetical protein
MPELSVGPKPQATSASAQGGRGDRRRTMDGRCVPDPRRWRASVVPHGRRVARVPERSDQMGARPGRTPGRHTLDVRSPEVRRGRLRNVAGYGEHVGPGEEERLLARASADPAPWGSERSVADSSCAGHIDRSRWLDELLARAPPSPPSTCRSRQLYEHPDDGPGRDQASSTSPGNSYELSSSRTSSSTSSRISDAHGADGGGDIPAFPGVAAPGRSRKISVLGRTSPPSNARMLSRSRRPSRTRSVGPQLVREGPQEVPGDQRY